MYIQSRVNSVRSFLAHVSPEAVIWSQGSQISEQTSKGWPVFNILD